MEVHYTENQYILSPCYCITIFIQPDNSVIREKVLMLLHHFPSGFVFLQLQKLSARKPTKVECGGLLPVRTKPKQDTPNFLCIADG
jgi:hypothetical protein